MPQNPLTNAPIPGQSLTQSPDSKGPWEMPPKFPDSTQALDHLFGVVTNKDFVKNYATLVGKDKKAYIDRIASAMLQEGFINGLWTVDTAMLLVEPLIALLVWTAAQLDATVSFSNDTGYEDRTGFEYVREAVTATIDPANANPQPTAEDKVEAAAEIPEGQPTETPNQPNVATPSTRQSPLAGGQ